MNDPIACRLILDAPRAGAWNMAADELLLEIATEQGVAALRFYRWAEPTLSLGYFQSYAERNAHPASLACPVVRRASGGGAILHDDEITYSLAMPARRPASRSSGWLYDAAHGALIGALAACGVTAVACSEPVVRAASDEPFLCFQRRAKGDVLVGDTKICGSAQRRRGSAILQHGSLLLRALAAAPELPGLADVVSASLRDSDVAMAWRDGLVEQLNLDFAPSQWSGIDCGRIETLALQKYNADPWTKHR